MALKFTQQKAQFLGKIRQSRSRMKNLQLRPMTVEQGAECHHAALVIEQSGWYESRIFQQKCRQPVKRQDLQAREARQRCIGKQLPFELGGGLLGGEQKQWKTFGRAFQFDADFRKTAEGFSAAGRAE